MKFLKKSLILATLALSFSCSQVSTKKCCKGQDPKTCNKAKCSLEKKCCKKKCATDCKSDKKDCKGDKCKVKKAK